VVKFFTDAEEQSKEWWRIVSIGIINSRHIRNQQIKHKPLRAVIFKRNSDL